GHGDVKRLLVLDNLFAEGHLTGLLTDRGGLQALLAQLQPITLRACTRLLAADWGCALAHGLPLLPAGDFHLVLLSVDDGSTTMSSGACRFVAHLILINGMVL